MKKMMKKIKLFFFEIVCFFISLIGVNANEIKNIDMEVYIDQYGNASVKEIWNVYLDEGTEGYRVYNLMGESEISNFRVVDDTGREYENVDKWDTAYSFGMKSYKSGINKIYEGVELCWGISKYGNRTYTLYYDISNFVTQYTDTQGIYFNMLDLDQKVGDVTIKIYSDTLFSLNNTRIWNFGNKGSIEFDDGSILMKSDGKLKDSQYMTLLVRFEYNIFNLNNVSSRTFDSVYDEAMEDVSLKEKFKDFFSDYNLLEIFSSLVMKFIYFLFNPITLFVLYLIINLRKSFRIRKGKRTKIYLPKYGYGNLDFGVDGKKIPDNKDINYFKEIPCNKDLCFAYWVCYQYEVVLDTGGLREGIIGAIMLKWIRDGYIKIEKNKKGIFSSIDDNYVIDLGENMMISNYVEYELYKMFKNASSDGRMLKPMEFEDWCAKNYDILDNWFYNIITYTSGELEKIKLITNEIRKINNKYSTKKKILYKVVNPSLKDEAIKLIGLRKYLIDFSSMSKKEYFDVHLWNEYLMFAMLLGVADRVSEQFSKLYPEFGDLEMIRIIGNFSSRGFNSYDSKKRYHSRPSYMGKNAVGGNFHNYNSGGSRSSGGGGSSYSGGGSSARGSGGGGFR